MGGLKAPSGGADSLPALPPVGGVMRNMSAQELERRIAAEDQHHLHDADPEERAFQALVVLHPEHLNEYDHDWTPGGAS